LDKARIGVEHVVPTGLVRECRPEQRVGGVAAGHADDSDGRADELLDAIDRQRERAGVRGGRKGHERWNGFHEGQSNAGTLLSAQERAIEVRHDRLETLQRSSVRVSTPVPNGADQSIGKRPDLSQGLLLAYASFLELPELLT